MKPGFTPEGKEARIIAIEKACAVTESLAGRGIVVLVTGSLAKGGFGETSDAHFAGEAVDARSLR